MSQNMNQMVLKDKEGNTLGSFEVVDSVAREAIENFPIKKIVSDSADTAPVLRSLESGTYVLQGKFRAYTGATSVLGFSSALMVNVIKSTAKSSVQVFYPVNNCVQFLEITDEAMSKTFVYLNQVLEHIGTMKDLTTEDKTSLVAAVNELVEMVSSMSGGTGGGITEETDPTVPEWAKQPTKPAYTADEVKARPNTWMPTAEDVGADASGTAASKVADHNAETDAHNDIRLLIQELDRRLTALADSDDTTLDQLSELVAYIKDNRELIESITTDKVNVADIINNLTTNATNKPLSAAQGVALKALIDSLTTTVNGKQTAEQVATAISNALKAYPTTTAMQTAISTALAEYAKADHNHDDVYAPKSHDHAGVYQPAGSYADADHNHDGTYAKPADIPTKLSQLAGDSTHRTVTDTEKTGWNGKADGDHNHDDKYQPKGDYLTQHQSLDHLLPKNQGASNAGKLMAVGADGTVTYIDPADLGVSGDIVGNFREDGNIDLLTPLAAGTYKLYTQDAEGNLTEYATMTVEEVTPTYTITWIVDGKTTTATVEEGTVPSFNGSTDKAADGQYTYTFKGWSPTVVAATADATYTAVYDKTAIETGPTNFANPSDAMWQVNNRLATAYGNGKTDGGTGHILTNFVPAKLNDEIYVTGLDLKGYADGKPAAVGIYTNNTDPQADYQKKFALTGVAGATSSDSAGNNVTATTANGVTTYVYKILEKDNGDNLADSDTAYIRIDGIAIEGVADSDIIINVKRGDSWL